MAEWYDVAIFLTKLLLIIIIISYDKVGSDPTGFKNNSDCM